MYKRVRGFTLAELLTVLAIIAVLAGLLFPVFLSVKESAKRAQCLSNFRSAQMATTMYTADYDDRFMPVNHRPGAPPNSRLDRTWVQVVLPYATSFALFSCPSDTSSRRSPETTFDLDLVPGDIYSQYYSASMHVNIGFNYLYLAPIVYRNGTWNSDPRSMTAVADPSRTLLFVDSIWDRARDGTPIGGGNWLVVPPCRYQEVANVRIDSFGEGGTLYYPYLGWKISDPNSARLYGNAWPWHSGRTNVARVDGSVKSIAPKALTAGCAVADDWRGTIKDLDQYMWDLQ